MKNLKNTYLKSCAAITVASLLPTSANAITIGAATSALTTNLSKIPALIRIVCYIAGLAFGIAGLIKLKDYMDKPGQGGGIKEPMGRLLIGAFLIALPTVLNMITSSSTGSGDSLALSNVNFS